MTEAEFQSNFTRWVKSRYKGRSTAFELKLSKTKSLPFSAFYPHQLEALHKVKYESLSYKIPDVGYGQKPFDMFHLAWAQAYIVVMYWQPGVRHFYLVDIQDYLNHIGQDAKKKKSLREEDAARLGERHELRLASNQDASWKKP